MSPPDPMAEATWRAPLDSRASPVLLAKFEYPGVMGTLGWQATNPACLVAEALSATEAIGLDDTLARSGGVSRFDFS